jgi:acyl carrier protein
MSIERRVKAVVGSVFGLAPERVTDDVSPRTVTAWDSIAHMQLVMALEAEFGVQFDPDEIPDLNSVGVIRARLESVDAR